MKRPPVSTFTVVTCVPIMHATVVEARSLAAAIRKARKLADAPCFDRTRSPDHYRGARRTRLHRAWLNEPIVPAPVIGQDGGVS